MNKKILVISHDASKTGAPILLLRLLELLRKGGWRINTIIYNRRGVLFEKFQVLSDHYCLYRPEPIRSLWAKLLKRISYSSNKPDIKEMLKGVSLVFNNTIVGGPLVKELRQYYKGPVISYLHESEYIQSVFPDEQELTLKYSDMFAVPDTNLKNYLVNKIGIPEAKIFQLNYFIPQYKEDELNKAAFLLQYGLKSSFVVGGAGALNWLKGPDIFIQVAYRFFTLMPDADVRFVWMGANKVAPEYKLLQLDIRKLKLDKTVLIVDNSDSMGSFYQSIDLLLLTSREDTYPLVVLEAASLSKPSICFNRAGGAAAFIGNDAGDCIDYLDVEKMTNCLVQYYSDRRLIFEKGEKAYRKVASLHQDEELILEQFNRIVANFL